MRQTFKLITLAMIAVLAAAALNAKGSGQGTGHPSGVRNIVLVHGAFADGSSWSKVIPLLQTRGFTVTAVQNPLTSLKDDVAATKRAIDNQDGRVLLVGHSWAGAVITQIGMDPKVAGLVFVAAAAPNAGQSFSEMAQGYPTPPGIARLKADAAGFLALPPSAIATDFAQDLPSSETAVMAVTQGPIAAACFSTKVTNAAWKTRPSWYIVAKRDRMIDPNLERTLARKIKARTLELDSSHAMMLSRPQQVAAFIASAASSL
ncbi:MAG: alpha/beta hydrolase [Candidatus Cybelea sp.]|jgi:pimeloyl-ACP methyl ester carboxylesterase